MSKRIARDVFLRRFRLERSYRPPILFRRPEWSFGSMLALAVGYHARQRSELTFVQVGAFDGVANDPIHPLLKMFPLRGLVVEPQARILAALEGSYAGYPHITLVHAAIADQNGQRELFSPAAGPSQQASFFREHLVRHGVSEDQIASTKVRCVTIPSLLEEHGLERCDLLQIDAEGYDYQILRTLDFEAVAPRIVRFEHAHMTDAECDECVELLAARGFRFIPERRDIIALREP